MYRLIAASIVPLCVAVGIGAQGVASADEGPEGAASSLQAGEEVPPHKVVVAPNLAAVPLTGHVHFDDLERLEREARAKRYRGIVLMGIGGSAVAIAGVGWGLYAANFHWERARSVLTGATPLVLGAAPARPRARGRLRPDRAAGQQVMRRGR